MSRLPNLTHVNRTGEQKALWSRRGRKIHICVRWRKRDNKKNRKRNRFQSPWLWYPQYTETGSEKEGVLTGCPCGGCCLRIGLRIEVCICVCVCVTHMDVYICVLCAYT